MSLTEKAVAQVAADGIINRLVENGIKSLPIDFLEYHQTILSPYRGRRRQVIETDDFSTADALRYSPISGLIFFIIIELPPPILI